MSASSFGSNDNILSLNALEFCLKSSLAKIKLAKKGEGCAGDTSTKGWIVYTRLNLMDFLMNTVKLHLCFLKD
jgi:hypothetical protein